MSNRPPADFIRALESLRRLQVGPFVTVTEIEAPEELAPYAAALKFETRQARASSSPVDGESQHAHAFLVILYDPAGQPGWDGTFRLVAHLEAQMEPELVADQCMGQVAWSWLHAALEECGAGYGAAAGTTTRVQSESFGGLASMGQETHLEIRASWTPATPDLEPHAQAVARLLGFAAGHLTIAR